ncbi:MAG: glycoside hydrolase family 25 [Ruminococcus sp.]|nr:glycoside hydrolase family 25 [Ruminococcus sp.]
MNKKQFFPCAVVLCMLTGCSNTISPDAELPEDSLSVMAEISEEASPARTEAHSSISSSSEVKAKESETDVNPEPPEEAVLSVPETVEIYEEITLSQLLADTNVQLENEDALLDTSQIGSFDVTVSYTYENEHYTHTLPYTVADTTAPVVLNAGWGAYVEQGDAFDLNEHVGFADNYDPAPFLSYSGSVDTNVCGTYPLTVYITDSSGNETSWEMSVEVVSEIPVPEDNNERISFDSFMEEYAEENVRFGIDVSTWQGDIDFEAVKNAGCSFVIMRIGHYYDEITMDDWYISNMEKARAAGLEVGVYIYTTANTEEEVRENARWITEQLGGQALDFPVVFDWESFSNFQEFGMSIHDLNALFEVFAEEMEQSGYETMLYSSKNFLNNFWYQQSDVPVWLAHYTDETDYAGEYAMWQMSCFGRIDGIAGDVDLNILYTDKELFIE